MSLNADLLKELDERFAQFAKEYGLKTRFSELDDSFFIKDFILSSGFISPHLGRQLSTRISDTFMGWNHYLHALVMPNPTDMIQMNESKLFSSTEKQDILKLISRAMPFVSTNAHLTLEPNPVHEATFIDDAFIFWETSYKPNLLSITEKVHAGWKK